MKKFIQTTILALALVVAATAEAKTVRAMHMTGEEWARVSNGQAEDLTVEFREGDQIPVTFSAKGDFLESTQVGTSYIRVKKSFWLRLEKDSIEASLDGVNYRPISEVAQGSFTVEASAQQGPVNAINLGFQSYLK